MSMNMYYAYQIHDRLNHYNLLPRGGRLFQQYVVTAYCVVEQSRLYHIRQNQSDIRNEYLSGLYDASLLGDRHGNDLGTRTVLTAFFTGGPRYMYAHYLDALAICRVHGNPSFFITFTCNAKCPEIQEYMEAFPELTTADRADIVDRMFEQKVRDYIKFVRNTKPFSDITAVLYTIEFQKRGLPHCHSLLWISVSSKVKEDADVDKYISAELPDLVEDPDGYRIISELMMHGPCDLIDEIRNFVEARYIGPHEACWRILEFPIHYRDPTVLTLAVHLENMKQIRFRGKDRLESIVDNLTKKKTTLTEWLDYNRHYTDGRHLTYLNFPSEYTWHKTDKCWQRKRRVNKPVIERLTYTHPSLGDIFYRRILLCHQKGCRSFRDIRTVNDIVYPTNRAACEVLGLIGGDQEWIGALEEASLHASSDELRKLFVQILIFCGVSDPMILWQKFWKAMSIDIPRRLSRLLQIPQITENETEMKAGVLFKIESILDSKSRTLKDFGLPMPPRRLLDILRNRLLMEERNYNRELLLIGKNTLLPKLNRDQKIIFDEVVNGINNHEQKLIFVYGHGGTGKTFLWKSMACDLRLEERIVLAVASSDLLRETDLIIWDEATMNDRRCFEALDRCLKDILDNPHALFGGKSIILGDFRQTLPVKKKASKAKILYASIMTSYLWTRFNVYTLHENMRLSWPGISEHEKERVQRFSSWLLDIGDGNIGEPDETDTENLSTMAEPSEIQSKADKRKLVLFEPEIINLRDITLATQPIESENKKRKITPKIESGPMVKIEVTERTDFAMKSPNDEGRTGHIICPSPGASLKLSVNRPTAEDLQKKVIVCPKNEMTDTINAHVLSSLNHEHRVYLSSDEATPYGNDGGETELLYPNQYLNTLKFAGLPPHTLKLKVGAPIILLHNLNLTSSLCNGTRMLVTHLLNKVIEAWIITGTRVSEKVFLPRILLINRDLQMLFVFKKK
nr:DNA helicase [Tanacetum cinerariifolium]